jgi:transcriptional regulator with XRE-family HTH domain
MDAEPVVVTMDPVEFAERFKTARLAAGLTQQQVADACGVKFQTVSAWENGRAKGMLAEHLFCICDLLRVDPRWLTTGEIRPGTALGEILTGLESLPVEQQEVVRQLVKSLKK